MLGRRPPTAVDPLWKARVISRLPVNHPLRIPLHERRMPRETAKLRYLIWQREVDLYWQERFRNHVHTWDWLNQEDFDGCWTHHLTALHLAYAVAVFEWQTWALREQFVKRDHWSFAVQLPAAGDLRKQLCLVQPCFNHWRPVNLSLSVCRLHHPKLKCETLPPTRRYLHH